MRKILYLAVVLSLLVSNSWAQDRSISGKVTSREDGASLPGVNVIIKGTNIGTVTDVDGMFKLDVPAEGGILVFTFIGLKTKELTIENQTVINLAIEADITQLSEVVVTALNIPREKRTLGYAVQEIKQEDLRIARETDINTALAGKIAGVQVIGGSGAKFGTSSIRIRGVRGLNAVPPLYVLDGIIIPDASSINMDNVASINVLKGAGAAALYGNRARDGVIIITSKKGIQGQLTIDFNSTTTFEKVATLPPYQNEYGGGYSQDFRVFTYDPAVHPPGLASLDGALYPNPMAADESWGAPLNGQQVAQWDAWIPGLPGYGKTRAWEAHPDNVRDYFETGVFVNNNISIGKGGEDYNVMATFTNSSRTGVIPGSDQNRNFLNILTSIDLSDKLTLTALANYNSTETNGNLTEGYQGSISQNFNQWWQRQLDMDLLKESWQLADGTYTSWNMKGPTNPVPQYWDNPYTYAFANKQLRRSEDLAAKAGISWEIIEDLTLSVNYTRSTRNRWFEGKTASGTLDTDNFTTWSQSKKEDNIEFILSYKTHFSADWSLSAIVGMNNRQNESYFWYESTVGGLSVPNLFNLKASLDRPDTRNEKKFKEVNSVFAQASIGWRETVYLDATVRTDWSSSLPSDNNSYTYPSVAATWIFSEHLSNQDVMSFGKLRLSYAQVGSDIEPYQLDPTFIVGTPYGNTPTMSLPNTLPNANLRPALSESIEAGVELKFLQNRIFLDFAIYKSENKDEIIQVSTPSTSGVSAAWINAGLTITKGYEITIGGNPVRNTNFNWDISFNAASYSNQVEELVPGLTTIRLSNGWLGTGTTGGWGDISANAKVGEEWGTIIGQAFERDDNGNIIVDATGHAKTVNDQILGSILPDFVGGIFNRFSYKNFDLAFTIDWQSGGLFHSITKMFNAAAGLSVETAGLNDKGFPQRDDPADGGGIKFDGVKEDGTPNDIYLDANDYWWSQFALHERWLYEASYVKVREIRLGYSFPSSMLGNTVKSLNLAIVSNNPWLISTSAEGLDPSQLSGDVVDARTNGAWVETGQLPGTRSIGFDIRIGF